MNERLNLRLVIYFSFTHNQKIRFGSLGYLSTSVEEIPMSDFLRVTKNKDQIERLIKLKRMSLRLVA